MDFNFVEHERRLQSYITNLEAELKTKDKEITTEYQKYSEHVKYLKGKNEWISVNQSLPENHLCYYQVTILDVSSVGKKWVSQLKFDGKEWICDYLDNMTWVTHWKPLPDPA